ncbi:MAG: hypothetical protein ACKVOI_18840 [Dongiaceae bacterium]
MSRQVFTFIPQLSRLYSAVTALAFGFGVSACSVAEYEPPIRTFSEAASSANAALSGYSNLAVKEVGRIRREQALATPPGVRFMREGETIDCQGNSNRCRVVILAQRDDPNPKLIDPEPPIQNILTLMNEIRKYGNGLQAIVAADTAARVERSVDSVNGNLVNLAKLVGQDKSFGSFATPAGEAIKWAFGAYINSVKLNALRTATQNADPLIADSVSLFTKTMEQADSITRESLAETVRTRLDAFRESRTDANLTNLLQAARAYDTVLTADPEAVFAGLAKAHSDLTKALNDDEISWDKAIASLEAVKTQAQRLEGIVMGLLAAANAEEG